MTRDDQGAQGAGCTIAVVAGLLVLLCGGGAVLLVGGGVYLARQQAMRSWDAERERALIEQFKNSPWGEKPLPPGAHAIAIGPSGELFWDDQPTDLERLAETLDALAPAPQRPAISIHIRPGIASPPEVTDQVRKLAAEYDEVVDPPPSPRIDLAPEPDEEPSPPGIKLQR